MKERQLLRTSPVHPVMTFASYKADQVMYLESHSELAMAYMLETDPDVKWFQSQPTGFLDLSDQVKRYTPDFRVFTQSGEYYLEVKNISHETCKETHAKFNEVSGLVHAKGEDLHLVFVDCKSNHADTAKTLYRYLEVKHKKLLKEVGTFSGTIDQLAKYWSHPNALPMIYSAMGHGVIGYNRQHSLDLQMLISY